MPSSYKIRYRPRSPAIRHNVSCDMTLRLSSRMSSNPMANLSVIAQPTFSSNPRTFRSERMGHSRSGFSNLVESAEASLSHRPRLASSAHVFFKALDQIGRIAGPGKFIQILDLKDRSSNCRSFHLSRHRQTRAGRAAEDLPTGKSGQDPRRPRSRSPG